MILEQVELEQTLKEEVETLQTLSALIIHTPSRNLKAPNLNLKARQVPTHTTQMNRRSLRPMS